MNNDHELAPELEDAEEAEHFTGARFLLTRSPPFLCCHQCLRSSCNYPLPRLSFVVCSSRRQRAPVRQVSGLNPQGSRPTYSLLLSFVVAVAHLPINSTTSAANTITAIQQTTSRQTL